MVDHTRKENYKPSPGSPAVFRLLLSSLHLLCQYFVVTRFGDFFHIIEEFVRISLRQLRLKIQFSASSTLKIGHNHLIFGSFDLCENLQMLLNPNLNFLHLGAPTGSSKYCQERSNSLQSVFV